MDIKARQGESDQLAEAALSRMRELGIAPEPANFAVWHAYVAGADPELVTEIDRLLESGAPLDDSAMERLYGQFFGFGQEGASVRDAIDKLEGVMRALLDRVGTTGSKAEDYERSLRSFQDHLGERDAEKLHAAIQDITTKTREMVEESRTIGETIKESTRQVVDLDEEMAAFEEEATRDGLTGLTNAKTFYSVLRRETLTAVENSQPLSLMMIGVDNLEQLADLHGPQTADRILQFIGLTLRDLVREADVAARYGPQRFAVLLPKTGLDEAERQAHKLREAFATRELVGKQSGRKLGSVVASVGLTQYGAEALTLFLKRATTSLDDAVQAGGDQVYIADQKPERHVA